MVLEGDVSQVKAVISSFDIGVDGVDKQLALTVRGVKAEHADTKVDVSDVVVKAGQPLVVKATLNDFVGSAETLSGATLRCECWQSSESA